MWVSLVLKKASLVPCNYICPYQELHRLSSTSTGGKVNWLLAAENTVSLQKLLEFVMMNKLPGGAAAILR